MGGCDESTFLDFDVLIAVLLLYIRNFAKTIRTSRRLVIRSQVVKIARLKSSTSNADAVLNIYFVIFIYINFPISMK